VDRFDDFTNAFISYFKERHPSWECSFYGIDRDGWPRYTIQINMKAAGKTFFPYEYQSPSHYWKEYFSSFEKMILEHLENNIDIVF